MREMNKKDKTPWIIAGIMILLIVASLAGIILMLLQGISKFPAEPQNYLWFSVRSERFDDSLPASQYISYAYVNDACNVYDVSFRGEEKSEGNYTFCIPFTVPKIRINPDEYVSVAKARMGPVDGSAEFKTFNYILPQLSRVYFGEERPYVEVLFRGRDKEYAVFYDAETRRETAFRESPLKDYPVCKTTADRGKDGRCSELRFSDGGMVFSRENILWQPALTWIKNDTDPSSVIYTWWDYYPAISVFAERKAFPSPMSIGEIDEAARFFTGEQTEEEALVMMNKTGAKYVVIDWTMIGKSGAPRFIATSDQKTGKEGSYEGYAQCLFTPSESLIKPAPDFENKTGKVDMVSSLVFSCNNGIALLFEIRNGQYSPDNMYVWASGNRYPWKSWRNNTGSSILGVQSFRDILGNALNYPDRYASFPTFTTLIYVPGKSETKAGGIDLGRTMFFKLYLSDHLEEYQQAGLADPGMEKPKYFKLVSGFAGDKQDSSYWGYVKVFSLAS